MKYLIAYEIRASGAVRPGEFEIELDAEPSEQDETLVQAAVRHAGANGVPERSVFGVHIVKVTPVAS